MNFLSNKQGFLGIDNKFNIKEKAIVVPFGLEKTVSYGGGTKNGPREIIRVQMDGCQVAQFREFGWNNSREEIIVEFDASCILCWPV